MSNEWNTSEFRHIAIAVPRDPSESPYDAWKRMVELGKNQRYERASTFTA